MRDSLSYSAVLLLLLIIFKKSHQIDPNPYEGAQRQLRVNRNDIKDSDSAIVWDAYKEAMKKYARRNIDPTIKHDNISQIIAACRENACFSSLSPDSAESSKTVESTVNIDAIGQMTLQKALLRPYREGLSTSKGKNFSIAVIGDSVGHGCCDSGGGGFGQAVAYFIEELLNKRHPSSGMHVQYRNLARGGTGPMRQYFCSDLQGDEDLIIYETVWLTEAEYVEAMIRYLQSWEHPPAIILLYSPVGCVDHNTTSLMTIAKSYHVPIINMLPIISQRNFLRCSYSDHHQNKVSLNWIYLMEDWTHPNFNGHSIIYCLFYRLFSNALNYKSDSNNAIFDAKPIPVLYPQIKGLRHPYCFSMVHDDPNKRLHVNNNTGFSIVTRRKQTGTNAIVKRCWEGKSFGSSLSVQLPRGTRVAITIYQKDDPIMAAAKISFDQGPASHVINGWMKRPEWLVGDRGLANTYLLPMELSPDLISHNMTLVIVPHFNPIRADPVDAMTRNTTQNISFQLIEVAIS